VRERQALIDRLTEKHRELLKKAEKEGEIEDLAAFSRRIDDIMR